MVYVILAYALFLISLLLFFIYGRIFLQNNKLVWLFCIGSAIVITCFNSVRKSLAVEFEHYGYTKYGALLVIVLLVIAIQFFSFRKPGLRFFNAFLAFIILKLAPFLSPELQIPIAPTPLLQLNLLLSNLTLLDISYKILFIGSLLVTLLLLLLTNQSYWDVPRYSLDYLSKEEKEKLIEKYSLETVKREYAAQNQKISTLSRRIITDIDEVSYRLVGFGHFLLTWANLVGCVWANESLGSLWLLYVEPTQFCSLITWLIFTIYLYIRLILKGTKLQTSFIGFIGFIGVCISFCILIFYRISNQVN